MQPISLSPTAARGRVRRATAAGLFATTLLAAPVVAQDEGCDAARTLATSQRYSPVQLRSIGRRMLAAEVDEHGRADNANDRREVAAILARLVRATGAPIDVQWELVGNPQINASALPGGIMVINQGLVTRFRELATAETKSPAEQRARLDGYLAAVLGHELAHVTLGHSDSLANDHLRCATARLVASGRRIRVDSLNADEERELAKALSSTRKLRQQAQSRDVETAADRVGALYMLRAGWEIQQAMDLFRRFDAMERGDTDRGLASLTWFKDHPRASQREAALEQFRGQLKMHQAEFDDALLLVQHGVMLDSAVKMLDRVLADFPRLAPVRHARAAALHEMWMETATPSARQVQTTVPTYEASFISGIRTAGSVGDAALLDSARREYRRVLDMQRLPFALSNLAVLDAYAGDRVAARARADSAARMMPDNLQIANNRAAVLYLTNDVAGARAAWTTLANRTAAPLLRFNLGRAALAQDDRAAALPLLTAYADGAEDSPWGREAARLIGRPDGAAGSTTRRVSSNGGGGRGGRIAGIALGMSAAEIQGVLGRADSTENVRGGSLLRYPSRGLGVGISNDRGAALIIASSRAAGPADGISVGDPLATVTSRWGRPVAVRENLMVFDRGGWMAVLEMENARVARLALRLP